MFSFTSTCEVLSIAFARLMSPEVVLDLANGLRQSSFRQYESCWKDFQVYLHDQKFCVVILNVVFEYMCLMLHVKREQLQLYLHICQLWPAYSVLSLMLSWVRDAWTGLEVFLFSVLLFMLTGLFWSLQQVLCLVPSPRITRDPSVEAFSFFFLQGISL